MSSVAFAEKLAVPRQSTDPKAQPYGEVPAVIRAELNVDRDRDILTRMQYLARKKRAQEPDITDVQMADYLALAENSENFQQWLDSRRQAAAFGPTRNTIAWVIGTLAIIALLTTGLITAIAVSVSGL